MRAGISKIYGYKKSESELQKMMVKVADGSTRDGANVNFLRYLSAENY